MHITFITSDRTAKYFLSIASLFKHMFWIRSVLLVTKQLHSTAQPHIQLPGRKKLMITLKTYFILYKDMSTKLQWLVGTYDEVTCLCIYEKVIGRIILSIKVILDIWVKHFSKKCTISKTSFTLSVQLTHRCHLSLCGCVSDNHNMPKCFIILTDTDFTQILFAPYCKFQSHFIQWWQKNHKVVHVLKCPSDLNIKQLEELIMVIGPCRRGTLPMWSFVFLHWHLCCFCLKMCKWCSMNAFTLGFTVFLAVSFRF